jgi:hypothetical protein
MQDSFSAEDTNYTDAHYMLVKHTGGMPTQWTAVEGPKKMTRG